MKVEVRNGNVDKAIRLLKRKLADENVFRELQEKRFYEKPSERRNRSKRAAVSRQRKADRDQRD